jgi:hypothetical protein
MEVSNELALGFSSLKGRVTGTNYTTGGWLSSRTRLNTLVKTDILPEI